MNARLVPAQPEQAPKRTGAALDYDVRLTFADGGTFVHKSRASSSSYALRLAVDHAVREGLDAVRAEVV